MTHIEFERQLMALDKNKLYEFLDGTIDMYLEYVNVAGLRHGNKAKFAAIDEMLDGTEAMIELSEQGEL